LDAASVTFESRSSTWHCKPRTTSISGETILSASASAAQRFPQLASRPAAHGAEPMVTKTSLAIDF
jgi:hypothetical protein